MADFSFTAGATPSAAQWNSWVRDQTVTICTVASHPTSPVTGRVAFETDTAKMVYFDGSVWQPLVNPLTAKGIDTLTTSAINALAGGNLYTGRLAYDTTLNILKYYDGSAWSDFSRLSLGISSMTTTTKNGLTSSNRWAGRVVWDTTVGGLYYWDGAAWQLLLQLPNTRGVGTYTTTQRDGLAGNDLWTGRLVYNTTSGSVEKYNGAAWIGIELPVGAITEWPVLTPPSGWLLCDGSAISRSTYATLFGIIAVSFGAGNGTTTFNLPSYNGKVSVGYDGTQTEFNAVGKTGGEKTHALTVAELPSHNHSGVTGAGSPHNHIMNAANNLGFASGLYGIVALDTSGLGQLGTGTEAAHTHTIPSQGSGTAMNVLQPYIAVPRIIKVT